LKDVKKIDKDNNGFVLSSELTKVLRMYYKELEGKNLSKIFKPFASV
jgi:Ca2+-binding EF-hand superfamily protein